MSAKETTPTPEDKLVRAGKMTGHEGALRTVKGLKKSRILTGPRAPRPSGRLPTDGNPRATDSTQNT